jgi:hypothetical protein
MLQSDSGRRARVRAAGAGNNASIKNGFVKRSVPLASRKADRTSASVRNGRAPIGVGGGEIAATRNVGATIIRREGIIPPMIGEDTRRTLANYPLVPTLSATTHSASVR